MAGTDVLTHTDAAVTAGQDARAGLGARTPTAAFAAAKGP